MPMDIRIPLLAGAALVAPLHASAAPTASGQTTVSDIGTVYNLAEATQKQLKCSPVAVDAPVPPENVATAIEYGNLGGMYAFAVAHFPATVKGDRDSQINTLVDAATRAYGQAYDCNPGPESALYLHRAIALLETHLERMDAANPLAQEFSQRATSFRGKLPGEHTCPICPKSAPIFAAEDTSYRGRYAERIALGVGIGGGQLTLHGAQGNRLNHLTLRINLGPRFVLGKRGRHILSPGLSYALHVILTIDGKSPRGSAAFHQAGPSLEYGFAPHPHISLHAHVGFAVGAGVFSDPDTGRFSFSAIAVGGGGGLCTLRTALCARVHGQTSVTEDSTSLTGVDATLNLDFFRLADLEIARRAAKKG